jgi:tape measure domain-containing protein
MAAANLAVVISANGTQFFQTLNKAEGAVGKFVNGVNNALTVGLGSIGLTNSFSTLIAQAAIAGVKTSAAWEQANISLKNMTGSAKKAESIFAGMKKLASETPVMTSDLIKSGVSLIAGGFDPEKIVSTQKALIDLSSTSFVGPEEALNRITIALVQMRQAGRVNAQDMKQLTEVGIDAWGALGRAMNKTVAEVRDMSENKLIDSTTGVNAILKEALSKKGFAKEQSKTLSGLWSTLKDNMEIALSGVGDAFATAIKPAIASVNEEAGKFGTLFLPALTVVETLHVGILAFGSGIRLVGLSLQAALVTPLLLVKDLWDEVTGFGSQNLAGEFFTGIGKDIHGELDATADSIRGVMRAYEDARKAATRSIDAQSDSLDILIQKMNKVAEADKGRAEKLSESATDSAIEKFDAMATELKKLTNDFDDNPFSKDTLMNIDDAAMNLYKSYQDVAKSMPELKPVKVAGFATIGSAAAVTLLNQRAAAPNEQKTMVSVLREAREELKQLKQTAADALQTLKDNALITADF